MNAGIFNPAGIHAVITVTRAAGTASGDVSYTGAGFKPKYVLFVGGYSHAINVGLGNVATQRCVWRDNDDAVGLVSANLVIVNSTGGGVANQTATIKSLDDDGFTLTWTKTGAGAAGEGVYLALCIQG